MNNLIGSLKLINKGKEYNVPVYNNSPRIAPKNNYLTFEEPLQNGAVLSRRKATLYDATGEELQSFILKYEVVNGEPVLFGDWLSLMPVLRVLLKTTKEVVFLFISCPLM